MSKIIPVFLIQMSKSLFFFLFVSLVTFSVPSNAKRTIDSSERINQASIKLSARGTYELSNGWKFQFEPKDSIDQLVNDPSVMAKWETVSVPHTWNALDGQSIQSSYKRGIGFYKLNFTLPENIKNDRYWIEFDAVSLVSNVWLNGSFIGRHEGGFGRFRYDITEQVKLNGSNVLTVKVDNSEQKPGSDTQNVPPFSGDFMVQGGIYRGVRILSTPDVHIDTMDDGGLGVYARTVELNSNKAVVNIKTLLANDLHVPQVSELSVQIVDSKGAVVSQEAQTVRLIADQSQEIEQYITVRNPHPWAGKNDPYLYSLVVRLKNLKNNKIDTVETQIGLRQTSVDRNTGFYLNKQHYPLHGVAMHQDFKDKGWAATLNDKKINFDLIKEIGANTVRFSHYPYDQFDYEMADRAGLIIYTEVPLVDTATNNADDASVSSAVTANMIRQVKEMIKQNFNHPSVAFWGLANEIGFTKRFTPKSSPDSLRDLFNQIRKVAHSLDPSRPTSQADNLGFPSFSENEDVVALNRYYGWYDSTLTADKILGDFDRYRKDRPNQPVGLTEYGFGAQITQHTDDPRVIMPANLVTIGRGANPDFMPEEYASYGHEKFYGIIKDQDYIFGTWIWNMFDFANLGRKEGDYLNQGLSLNNKGLVSFDRSIKKDAFYFYKVQWNPEPTLFITSKRYTERSYPVTNVKVYSNVQKNLITLTNNGKNIGSPKNCLSGVCIWENVDLTPGQNLIQVTANIGSRLLKDTASWNLNDYSGSFRVAVGSGSPLIGRYGQKFGSDAFLTEDSYESSFGVGNKLSLSDQEVLDVTSDLPKFKSVTKKGYTFQEPVPFEPFVFRSFRTGTFSYNFPVKNGNYEIKLGFFEPEQSTLQGSRLFNISVNGRIIENSFDVFKEAGGKARKAVIKEYPASVEDNHLKIDFLPVNGKAVLSFIEISKIL